MPDDGGSRGSVRKVCTRTAHHQIAWAVFSSRYQSMSIASAFVIICARIDRIVPDFSTRPHIHQRHSLTFRGGQRLVLQCSTCVDILSCSYTLCIRLITCQSLLLPNTSTHLLESHPFPLSLLSSFVITLLFSISFLPIRCVKPSFGTPSGSNLLFSPFSSLSKYPFHLPNIIQVP